MGIRSECNDFAGRIFDVWALHVDRHGYAAAVQLIPKDEVVSSITAASAKAIEGVEQKDSENRKLRISSWNIAGLGMLLDKRKTTVSELRALQVDAGAL